MVDLKFRAWNKYGMAYFTFREVTEFDGTPGQCKWPEPTEIMQYTGLKDKNGKEIYEGDIISIKSDALYSDDETGRLGIVRFGEGTYDSGVYKFQGFYIEQQDHYDYKYNGKDTRWTWKKVESDGTANILMSEEPYFEVIGNIFETPNLLK